MNELKCVEVKIEVNNSELCNTVENDILQQLAEIFEGKNQYHTIKATEVNIAHLSSLITEAYGDSISIRDRVSGGCFGARTGSSGEGLTLWCCLSLFPERWLTKEDGEVDEWINPYHLVEENAEYIEGLDGDAFVEQCEALGLEVKHDNTTNYFGHSSEDGVMLVDMDFKHIYPSEDGEGAHYLVIMFHCGGDIRGNYTDRYVYKVDSEDEIYSILAPTCWLKEEDSE